VLIYYVYIGVQVLVGYLLLVQTHLHRPSTVVGRRLVRHRRKTASVAPNQKHDQEETRFIRTIDQLPLQYSA
jgi:hypothetical protein